MSIYLRVRLTNGSGAAIVWGMKNISKADVLRAATAIAWRDLCASPRATTMREEWIDLALSLCRGSYQERVVVGRARLSGSDLRGKAARYSARYGASRRAIQDRLRAAGVPFRVAGTGRSGDPRALEVGAR